MRTATGLPTNALYGFTRMLLRAHRMLRPRGVYVATDIGESFRKEYFPEYKATRQKSPEDLLPQVRYFPRLVEALGARLLALEGLEADDLLATIAEQWRVKSGVVLVTGDRDLLQLLRAGVRVWYTRKGVTEVVDYTEKRFAEEYGFPPHRLPDYKALVGDPSDNIPGVKGIGEKTARRLLQEYGSLEGILQALPELPKRERSALQEAGEKVFLWRELTTLRPRDITLPEPGLVDPDQPAAQEIFAELEFRTLVRRKPALFTAPRTGLTSLEALRAHRPAGEQPAYVLWREEGWWLEGDGGRARWEGARWEEWAREAAVWDWKEFVRTQGWAYGEKERPQMDALVAAYLLDPAQDLRLQAIRRAYGGGSLLRATRQLARKLRESGMWELMQDLYLPVQEILAEMERWGVRVDRQRMRDLEERLSRELEVLTRTVREVAGLRINLNSPKQVAQLLYDHLKLPAPRNRSTSAEALAPLAEKFPIVKVILEYRVLSRLRSVYVRELGGQIAEDGRVHTRFLVTGTQTGRLSSRQPNLQNLPARGKYARWVRSIFVPSAGHRFLAADYSQIDLRVLAHLSGDEHLVALFEQDRDIHTETARRLFGVEEVTPEVRRRAKAVNFGIIYGMGEHGLAQSLGVSRSEAREILERYFARFPGVRRFIEETIQFARERGYVETLLGRRRWVPEVRSRSDAVRRAGERVAVNTRVQGSTADIVMRAMIRVREACTPEEFRMLIQIHDELVGEVPEPRAQEVARKVRNIMKDAVPLRVPLKVHTEIGASWGEMEEVEESNDE